MTEVSSAILGCIQIQWQSGMNSGDGDEKVNATIAGAPTINMHSPQASIVGHSESH